MIHELQQAETFANVVTIKIVDLNKPFLNKAKIGKIFFLLGNNSSLSR